jgi:hypothetical protein
MLAGGFGQDARHEPGNEGRERQEEKADKNVETRMEGDGGFDRAKGQHLHPWRDAADEGEAKDRHDAAAGEIGQRRATGGWASVAETAGSPPPRLMPRMKASAPSMARLPLARKEAMSRMTASEEWNIQVSTAPMRKARTGSLPTAASSSWNRLAVLKGAEACLMRVSDSSINPRPMRARPRLCGRSFADHEWTM